MFGRPESYGAAATKAKRSYSPCCVRRWTIATGIRRRLLWVCAPFILPDIAPSAAANHAGHLHRGANYAPISPPFNYGVRAVAASPGAANAVVPIALPSGPIVHQRGSAFSRASRVESVSQRRGRIVHIEDRAMHHDRTIASQPRCVNFYQELISSGPHGISPPPQLSSHRQLDSSCQDIETAMRNKQWALQPYAYGSAAQKTENLIS